MNEHAGPFHVLIVDDDQSIVTTMGAILQREGYRVSTAGTLKGVRSLLGKQTFHVAIVDLRLGEDDGIDVLQTLQERQPACVCIVLTGYASLESAMSAMRCGAYDYLIKPCDLDELKVTVARAAERNALESALQARVAELEAANAQIRAMAERMQQELEKQVAERTAALAEAIEALELQVHERERAEARILELSTPVLQVREHLLLVPVIGVLTEQRASYMTEQLLREIRSHRVTAVVMDLTGLAGIGPGVAHQLLQLIAAAKLLGATAIITGLSTNNTRQLVSIGDVFGNLLTAGDLQSGIEEAERLLMRPYRNGTAGGVVPRSSGGTISR